MVRNLSPEKRAKLLSAALHLFAAVGVQHTTTAEIAKAAGTAAGTLFLYFPTKQDLMNELVLQISREQSSYINSLLVPSFSARDAFFAIWNGSIHWLLANLEAFQYVQQVRDTGIIPESVVAESARDLAYYFVAIQKGWDEGSIKPYPVDMIGGFLYQDIVAVMNLTRTLADPGQREVIIQQGFEIFWSGIKAD